MTALAHLNPTYTPSFAEEILIWRQANTIFMADGHPGTSALGLGVAGLARQRKVSVFGQNLVHQFTHLNLSFRERDAQRIAHEADRKAFIEHGGRFFEGETLTPDLFQALLERGDKVLSLLWLKADPRAQRPSSSDLEPHWVVVTGADRNGPCFFDPYPWDKEGLEPPVFNNWETFLNAMHRGAPHTCSLASIR